MLSTMIINSNYYYYYILLLLLLFLLLYDYYKWCHPRYGWSFVLNSSLSDAVLGRGVSSSTVISGNLIGGEVVGRWDDTVGSPHRAQISQFELFELVRLPKSDRRFPVEQVEAAVSQSTVPSPPSIKYDINQWINTIITNYVYDMYIYIYIYIPVQQYSLPTLRWARRVARPSSTPRTGSPWRSERDDE